MKVSINFTSSPTYPEKAPFDPPVAYPEYRGKSIDPKNNVYEGVREALFRLGLDIKNYNTKDWNPFGEFVKPGMTVFIKPNTVIHNHEKKKDIFAVIIHASILRPILDYVCKALNDSGKIIIGDSQLIFSDHKKALDVSKIKELIKWYSQQTPTNIECIDLRVFRGVRTWLYGKWGRVPLNEDKRGYKFVNLGEESCFKGVDPKRLRISIANPNNMVKHHSNGKHEYLFPSSLLESDVVISIPKLKTHRRTAVTLAIKNFMGIPSLKDSLPHYTTDSVEEGGDQYINPSLRKRMCTRLHDEIQSSPYLPVKFICAVIKKIIWNSHLLYPFKDNIYEGMWRGNDTLWRTLIDLNRAVVYADKNGNICDKPQRKTFFIVDGVVGGEKDGPLTPDPVYSGVILAGFDPVSVDIAGATLMGFDVNKIPLIKNAIKNNVGKTPLFNGNCEDIQIIIGEKILNINEFKKMKNLKFEAHPNWKGDVEL